MVMKRLGLISGVAAVAVAVAASSASAQTATSLPSLPPLTATAPVNWTGLYFGGDIGSVFSTAHFTRPGSGLGDTTIGSISPRPTYGMYGGLNYQALPWLVVGIEGDYTKLSAATYRELGSAFDFLENAEHIDAITGRLGVLLSPDTMVYGRAGPARVTVQGFQGFGFTPFHQSLPGVQVGAGIETLLTPYVSLRADASYTYADQLLSLNMATDLYRPGFLLFQVGAAFQLDPPASLGLGEPATKPLFNMASLSSWSLWNYWNPPAAKPSPMLTKAPPRYAKADPVDPPAPNWTGLEFGGFVSANGNKVEYNDTNAPAAVFNQYGPFTDFAMGGGWFVGANYQLQRLVLGAEVSGNYESATFNNVSSGNVVNDFAKIDRILAVTGRIGWLVTPTTLFYGKAGPATIRMTPNHDYFNAIAPNNTQASVFPGYQAGIGAETFILPNLSLRAEGTYTYTGHSVTLQGVVPNEFTLKPSVVSALIGLALHI
jgi:opacity protein-like surface antigen